MCHRRLITFALLNMIFSGSDGVAQESAAQSSALRRVATPAASSGGEWRQFRGPGGLGVGSAGKAFPAKWDEQSFRWKTPLPGAGASSPVVFRDRIYITCYSGFGIPGGPRGSLDQLKLQLVCLDRLSGIIRWERVISPTLPEQETIRDEHGYSSSTPVVDDDFVYVFFGKTGVFAFSHDGEKKWQATVGAGLNGWGTAASPVIYEDLLIVNASVESESVVALNRTSGKEVWRTGGIREAWNSPLLMQNADGRTELIVPIFGQVLSLDPATGDRIWTCDTGIKWYMVPSAVAYDGTVYCVGGRSGDALAIRSGGTGDVTATHRLWQLKKGSNVSSPIFHDDHLYWINDQRGICYCANAKTGELIYEERLPRVGQVYASPILVDGKIICVSRDGVAIVLAADPEFKLLATNRIEERGVFNGSPAASDDCVLIRSNRYLYCIGRSE